MRFRIALWIMAASIAGIGATAVPMRSPAQSPARTGVKEYELKAVFLLNFTRFADWPDSAFTDAQSPLIIGVVGDNPFGSYLTDVVRGERVNGRPIVVRRYRTVADLQPSHILFVSRSEREHVRDILEALHGRTVLTVSDVDDFAARGGVIQFVTENNKIRLGINVDAAKAANVTISSKLLRSAEIVAPAKE